MSIEKLGKFIEIREVAEKANLPYLQNKTKGAINTLASNIDKTSNITMEEADKLLEQRLASRASSVAFKGGMLYQQGKDEIANNFAKENGFKKVIYKGKMGDKDIYLPLINDDDKPDISGLPRYIVVTGDKAELVFDNKFEITDFLDK